MIATDTVKIFVVEGQALFGKALCQLFSLDRALAVVGDSESINPAAISKARPDVILMDIDGHSLDLDETMASFSQAAPQARVCILSMKSQPEVMQRCLAAGAQGYLMKDVTPSELISAVKMVAAGHTYVDPRVAGGLLRRRSMSQGRPDLNELSVREIDVIRLIAEGLSNKEISDRLTLSEKTVKNHISRIFSKLNICARTQAAVHAIKTGLV
ncbi:MAG: response regulator transcription factor [Candidatus Eremiobacteraeota bacterium]|nr:response regulator transcription factor [Candidatus Eremiobacteraeota bacterium]